jgi:predicted GTPase
MPMNVLKLISDIKESFRHERDNKPFVVSILGQTGVGKSSLINALFDLDVPTDDTRPCTPKPTEYTAIDGLFRFIDMPGIGESTEKDDEFLSEYKHHMVSSDVLIWALHADNRSLTFDAQSLKRLIQQFDADRKASVLSKLVFVLTKADLLTPKPWVLGYDSVSCSFRPQPDNLHLFERKVEYVFESLLLQYANEITIGTRVNSGFVAPDPQFQITEGFVKRQGLLSRSECDALVRRFPSHAPVLLRLRQQSYPVVCSSRFRYNLNAVMEAIISRLDFFSILRFQKHFEVHELEELSLKRATEMSNIIAFDKKAKAITYDLTSLCVPVE